MADKSRFQEVIAKSLNLEGLTSDEAAFLLQVKEPDLQDEIFRAAKEIKLKIYGNRLVFFAPLYLTNNCVNDCLYCGFRKSNHDLKRKTLSVAEVNNEVRILTEQGHKRLLLVAGEDLASLPIGSIAKIIDQIYQNADIRRINVNAAPMSVESFRVLKTSGIGTYQLFQETYHRQTYAKMHPSGPKSDYDWRFLGIDRAMAAGIDDVGMGVLFGLYEPIYEVKALIEHCRQLEQRWGVGPHTLSVPRMRRASGSSLPIAPYDVDDSTFKLIVAVLRLAVPYTGIILSTREKAELRDELIHLGVSQISAGSKTNPGGYENKDTGEQFEISDNRELSDIVQSVVEAGYLPSFCTACYRQERTGNTFMNLAKGGLIKGKCSTNAVLTFAEYLRDFASPELKNIGEQKLQQDLSGLSPQDQKMILTLLEDIEKGGGDLFV